MPVDYFGFNTGDDAPQPNRAERRAMERKRAQQKRRGQRAYDRTLRNIDRMSPAEAAATLQGLKDGGHA